MGVFFEIMKKIVQTLPSWYWRHVFLWIIPLILVTKVVPFVTAGSEVHPTALMWAHRFDHTAVLVMLWSSCYLVIRSLPIPRSCFYMILVFCLFTFWTFAELKILDHMGNWSSTLEFSLDTLLTAFILNSTIVLMLFILPFRNEIQIPSEGNSK